MRRAALASVFVAACAAAPPPEPGEGTTKGATPEAPAHGELPNAASAPGVQSHAGRATASPRVPDDAALAGPTTEDQLRADTADVGPETPIAQLRADAPRILAQLEATILGAFARDDTDHAVFDCCIDWHSSVHAHWALLETSAALGHDDVRDQVLASLDAAGLDAERKSLVEHPDFERPYGRAWFLRLALTHRAQTGRPDLSPLATVCAASLRELFTKRPPDPRAYEYDNAAWALAQLHAYYLATDDEAGVEFVRALVKQHYLDAPPLDPREDHRRDEFFSRWGNAGYLVAATHPDALAAWFERSAKGAPFNPIRRPRSDHHLGMNFSRAWGLCAMGKVLGDERLLDASARHVRAAMRVHEAKKDDYDAYGHWVGQFGVYAVRCLME